MSIRHKVELVGSPEYRKELRAIAQEEKNAAAASALMNSTYDKSDKSIAALSQRQGLLRTQLDQQQKKVALTRAEYDKAVKSYGANSDAAQKLKRNLDYQTAAMNKTKKELEALDKEFKQANSIVGKYKAAVGDGTNALTKMGDKASDVGKKITKTLGAASTLALGFAVKGYLDLGDSMAIVSTIADTQAVSLEKLTNQALKASDATGVAASEIADAAYQAISSGADTKDAMAYVEQSAKAAKAGLTDTTTAVNGSSSAINAWGLSYTDAESVYDKFLAAQKYGKTTFGEIASSIGQVTGLAPQLGISLDEVLATTASLTKQGLSTSQTMTMMKAVMQGVVKPTSEASETAKSLGLDFSSAAVKSKGFTAFLQDVMDKTGSDEDKLAKLFGSVEGLSAVMALGGSAAQDYAGALEAIKNADGMLNESYAARVSSDSQKLQISLNQLKNTGIRVAQAISPVIDGVTNALAQAGTSISKLDEGTLSIIGNALLMGVALGPVVSGVGKILTVGGKLFTVIKGITAAIGGGAFAGILLGIAAIAAACVGVSALLDKMDKQKQLQAVFDSVMIDTKAIDEAIADAENVRYQMKIFADARLDLSTSSKSLNDSIVEWLSDGKKNTWKQKKDYEAQADELFKPLFDAVSESYATRKEALERQLAQGGITGEEYDSQLADLKAKTEATTAELTTATENYKDYVLTLAKSSKDPTEAQIAELEALRLKVLEIGESILLANNATASVGRADYIALKSGRGTSADVGNALGYAQGTRENALAVAKDTQNAASQAFTESYNAASAAGDEAGKTAALDAWDKAKTAYEESVKKANLDYAAMINDIFNGLAEVYPDEAENLKQMDEIVSVMSELRHSTYNNPDLDPTETGYADTLAAIAKYQDMAGIDSSSTKGFKVETGSDLASLSTMAEAAMRDMYDMYIQKLGELGGEDGYGLFNAMGVVLGSGGLDADAMAGIKDTAADVISALDMKGDSRKTGEDTAEGWVEGYDKLKPTTLQTVVDNANSAMTAWREALGVHSPSTVADEIGYNTGVGFVNGFSRGMMGLQTIIDSYKQIIAGLGGGISGSFTASAGNVGGLITGSANRVGSLTGRTQSGAIGGKSEQSFDNRTYSNETIVNNYYNNVSYSGMVSQRDTRKLSAELARMSMA